MYAELPSLVGALQGGSGPKVSGTKAKPIPVRLDVLDLLAPARVDGVVGDYRDQTGYASVATVLTSWAYDWRESLFADQRQPDSASVGGLVSWLRNRLDIACDQHSAIGDFATEISRLWSTLARITERESNHVDEKPVAQKLAEVKATSFTGIERFSVPENGQRPSDTSINLDALLTASMAALAVNVSKMTISNWRKANKLTPVTFDRSGHAQYRLGDILAAANKRQPSWSQQSCSS
ncbi:hypothetical protein V6U81_04355 [Micromonospora sp. CPCC 205711]|uniref:hypothetical protein n=1 Tax=Micromonospora sp. CPCC 205547 TaxID=3122400 RepID=UPI002FF193E5